MGWAEKLPSGRYRGVYRDALGRRRSAGTFTHKARAERAAASEEDKARRSIWSDPDAAKRTWGEWVDEWWPTRNVEPGTAKSQLSYRDTYLRPRWGTVAVGGIRRHDVRGWAMGLVKTDLSPATVQRIVHLLSASLNAAIDAEIIDTNPAARIRLPQGAQAGERFLTGDEFAAIVGELPSLADWLVAQTLVSTGLRWGEMAGLHRDRFHPELGIFRVVEVYDEKTHRIKPYPKGRRVRDVPVPEWLGKLLVDVDPMGDGCGVQHTAGRCRAGLLFTTAGGAVLRDTNWSNRVWRPAVARAGLTGVRPHDLRHTYASWLLQGGRPLSEVGKLMGHVSPATTQKYAWLAEADVSAVLAALPAAPRLPHGFIDETGAAR